eukprot:TRINITY_DN20019_c0_g1_i1.p1 TRINITY_DN20019_c0_g1~~TRINITY_DN20019_c0_g1_i1.p1  ORF type:complete len:416 (+),score=105.42 TRINITY_DN20019_c0_g1_i1:64-1311(+)
MGISGAKERARHTDRPEGYVSEEQVSADPVEYVSSDGAAVSLWPLGCDMCCPGRLLFSVDGEVRPSVEAVEYDAASNSLRFPELQRGVMLPAQEREAAEVRRKVVTLCDSWGIRHDGLAPALDSPLQTAARSPRSPGSPSSRASESSFSSRRREAASKLYAVRRRTFKKLGGDVLPDSQNPGCWLVPDVVDAMRAAAVARESRDALRSYGCSVLGEADAEAHRHSGQIWRGQHKPNLLRATGRKLEDRAQAPWGCGAELKPLMLPECIRELAQQLADTPPLAPAGKLIDVTIDFRDGGYHGRQPQAAQRCSRLCIVSLLSDNVVTLVPPAAQLRDAHEAASLSWTDEDVDCMVPARHCLVLTGDALSKWSHGTRLGMEAPQNARDSQPPLCDWFGRPDQKVVRKGKFIWVEFAYE